MYLSGMPLGCIDDVFVVGVVVVVDDVDRRSCRCVDMWQSLKINWSFVVYWKGYMAAMGGSVDVDVAVALIAAASSLRLLGSTSLVDECLLAYQYPLQRHHQNEFLIKTSLPMSVIMWSSHSYIVS